MDYGHSDWRDQPDSGHYPLKHSHHDLYLVTTRESSKTPISSAPTPVMDHACVSFNGNDFLPRPSPSHPIPHYSMQYALLESAQLRCTTCNMFRLETHDPRTSFILIHSAFVSKRAVIFTSFPNVHASRPLFRVASSSRQ